MKTCRGNAGEAWGIMNPYGDIWTTRTFETKADAVQHVKDFWTKLEGGASRDLSLFRPVRVKVHVTLAKPPTVKE